MTASAAVQCTFLGTSTVLVTDGRSSILVDGFFSRPSLVRIALGRRIRPDLERIRACLARAGVERLDALVVAHSHHDHAMDVAEVARLTGAVVHGSESTLNVARGGGLAEESLRVIADGDELVLGSFSVRVVEGLHSPGDRFPGVIEEPLVPPVRASAYRTGACYSFHVGHAAGSVLVHPSANAVPHAFDGLGADVLYLGVGGLGKQTEEFQTAYWEHTVGAVAPKVVVPIHWDDFGRPLTSRLRAMPRLLDDFGATTAFLRRCTDVGGPEVRFQDPFERLVVDG